MDCRDGYVRSTALDACLPDCNEGFSCADGYACRADGLCRIPKVKLAPIDSPCTTSSDCASGCCVPQTAQGTNTGWIGGMCSKGCTSSAGCPSGSKCTLIGGSRYCLPVCSSGAQCRGKYVCDGLVGTCLPNCNDGFSCGTLRCAANGQCTFGGDGIGG